MKKILFIALGLLFMALVSSPCFANPNYKVYKAKYEHPGSYKVLTLEYPDLVDTSRNNRPVPLKVYYPAKGKNFPLVVFSHGSGGYWDSYIYMVQHLVSHGYVVICPQHKFSDNEQVRFYMSSKGGRLRYLEAIFKTTRDPRAMLGRPKDISFAINQAIRWNNEHKQLQGKININKIGVMGHSYGAYTTLTACGAQPILDYMNPPVNPGSGLVEGFNDSRITFGLTLSPQPPGGTYFNKDSYKTIHCPIVGISGSSDYWKTFDDKKMAPEKRWQFWELLPEGNNYFLWLENASHFSFTDNPKAWMFPTRSRSDVQYITKAMMVLFSDYFLKERKETADYMNRAYANSLCGRVVTDVQWHEK